MIPLWKLYSTISYEKNFPDVSQEEIEGLKDWCETIRVFEMDLMYQTDSVLNGK